jgi:hypothetical protein
MRIWRDAEAVLGTVKRDTLDPPRPGFMADSRVMASHGANLTFEFRLRPERSQMSNSETPLDSAIF